MSKKNKKELLVTQKVQKEKEKLLISTQKELINTYKNIAKKIEKKLKNKSDKTFTEKDLKDLQKEINNELREATKEVKVIIENNTVEMISKAVEKELEYFKEIDKEYKTELAKHFKDKFVIVNKVVLDAVIKGNMYKDKHSLSNRIWKDYQNNKGAINAIIRDGIKNNDHPLDIAKRLEKFVNPTAKKDFYYTRSKFKAEYNSLRLARTSINHAHHQSVIAMAKRNPLVKYVEWNSSHHARMCDLCASRDGVRYLINDVPQDHPNGVCIVFEVLPTDEQWDKIMDLYLDSNFDDFDEFANTIDVNAL